MAKKLVLVGGGHAHMMILDNLAGFVDKNIAVTVIGPSSYHYYSGMGPGMLGGTYTPEDIRFATRQVVEKTTDAQPPDSRPLDIENLCDGQGDGCAGGSRQPCRSRLASISPAT